jgi:hypothetical protein
MMKVVKTNGVKRRVIFIISLVVLLSTFFVARVVARKTTLFLDPTPASRYIEPHVTPTFADLIEEQQAQCELDYEVTGYFTLEPSPDDDIQKNIGYQNNKFGLYVYSTGDFIRKADEMINTNGGDWGYVLIPYNVRDRDGGKWRELFDLLAQKHLIPIIQLWDVSLDDYEDETRNAAKFLDNLNWPIKHRYISAYNEMNDSRFWKGKLDPEGYAKVLEYTIEAFNSRDEDFFILNGAFNSTAPNGNGYMEQLAYMRKMNDSVPGIFEKLDGWASHPYPQPAFTGLPTDTGRVSIRAYEWELAVLQNEFDVDTTNLPVFITETGWPHAEGENYNSNFYNAETVSKYIKQAFEDVWLKDDRVVAVTPFTIYYDPPFDHFSWVDKDGHGYMQFDVIKQMRKVQGKPPVNLPVIEKRSGDCVPAKKDDK